ncbi:MAG: hypothetical protein LBQ77_02040 [Treponema sp.]|jgi:outer membrane biogenesis lipoprotein LolB|nr:hypothetical protein [Treponema sp.]
MVTVKHIIITVLCSVLLYGCIIVTKPQPSSQPTQKVQQDKEAERAAKDAVDRLEQQH